MSTAHVKGDVRSAYCDDCGSKIQFNSGDDVFWCLKCRAMVGGISVNNVCVQFDVESETFYVEGRVDSDADTWLVGRNRGEGRHWEVLGIYDDEVLANLRCRKDFDFVAPLKMNAELPERRKVMPGAYYPIAEDRKRMLARAKACTS